MRRLPSSTQITLIQSSHQKFDRQEASEPTTNQAFKQASGQFFCVINPDIRFDSDHFSDACVRLRDPAVGVVAERWSWGLPVSLKTVCGAFHAADYSCQSIWTSRKGS